MWRKCRVFSVRLRPGLGQTPGHRENDNTIEDSGMDPARCREAVLFFFRGAQSACGRAIFCGKHRYLRGILGVLSWDSQRYREVEASDRRKHVLCRWLGGPLFLELARISNAIEKVRPHVAKVPRSIGPMATRAGPGRPGVDRDRPGRFRGPPEDHFWNKWTRSLQNQSTKSHACVGPHV